MRGLVAVLFGGAAAKRRFALPVTMATLVLYTANYAVLQILVLLLLPLLSLRLLAVLAGSKIRKSCRRPG